MIESAASGAPHGARRSVSYLVIVLASVVLAVYLGKDFNWDQLGYHLYAGFNAFDNRIGEDYFAASSQSYLNPYSHAPFYWMLSRDFAPQAMVALLALFHSLNLLIVYEFAVLLNRRSNGTVAWWAVYLAVFFAGSNSIFIMELGTTFNEISTSVPVLAGWFLLLRGFDRPHFLSVMLAGLLIGMAVALKITNLFFSVTALPLILLAPLAWRLRARLLLCFVVGGIAGGLLAGGWWSWRLWQEFGNPLFPLFNHVFHSPHLPTGEVRHYRFLADGMSSFVLKPFMMLLPVSGVHIETVAPDLRYAALVLLSLMLTFKTALLRKPGLWPWRDPMPVFRGDRALAALCGGVFLAWLLWALTSSNSRYFLTMSCLVGVILATLLFRLSSSPRFLAYCGASLVLVQSAMVAYGGDVRWSPSGYGKSWFELDVPQDLKQQPALYLHLGISPASFLMPYLAPGSNMINLSGQYVIDDNAQVRALLDKHKGRVRVMQRHSDPAALRPSDFNFALKRIGLQADLRSCHTIRFRSRGQRGAADTFMYYVACSTAPLQLSAAERQQFMARRQRADAVFTALEHLCPRYFQPHGLVTEGDGRSFWRNYTNTDTVLGEYRDGSVSFRNVFTHTPAVAVGNIEALARALPPKQAVCP